MNDDRMVLIIMLVLAAMLAYVMYQIFGKTT